MSTPLAAAPRTKHRQALADAVASMLVNDRAELAFLSGPLPMMLRRYGVKRATILECGRVVMESDAWGEYVLECDRDCRVHHVPKWCECGFATQKHRERIWLHRNNVDGCNEAAMEANRAAIRKHCESPCGPKDEDDPFRGF